MSVDKFIQDGQEPKIIDKLFNKVSTMLETNEQISYIAVQKKPAVTLLPDSIMISNKRIFLCEFTKLGLSMNFEIFHWHEIKDIAFKEEIFGSKVTVIPFSGENLSIDYIPKTQARKLFQFIKVALENIKSGEAKEFMPQENKTIVQKPISVVPTNVPSPTSIAPSTNLPSPAAATRTSAELARPVVKQTAVIAPTDTKNPAPPPIISAVTQQQPIQDEDELTLRLRKLKSLYDKQLITQAEYEGKKAEILSQI